MGVVKVKHITQIYEGYKVFIYTIMLMKYSVSVKLSWHTSTAGAPLTLIFVLILLLLGASVFLWLCCWGWLLTLQSSQILPSILFTILIIYQFLFKLLERVVAFQLQHSRYQQFLWGFSIRFPSSSWYWDKSSKSHQWPSPFFWCWSHQYSCVGSDRFCSPAFSRLVFLA